MTSPAPAPGGRPLLVGVGGFLGAGKTTAIVAAATALRARGRRVAVITNDQASGLVDTATARAALAADSVAEIAGGCFCCRFDDLARTLSTLIDRAAPEIILAEAVGSCTDLAATVYQPLRQLQGTAGIAPVRLGPLTVLVDAVRLRRFQPARSLPLLPADVGYLYGQQLAEADLLLLNKVDLVDPPAAAALLSYLEREHRGVPTLPLSALSGAGLDAWIARLEATPTGGARVLDLDYDRYAAAEAALGWLNLEGTVQPRSPGSAAWSEPWVRTLLEEIVARVTAAGAEVAHCKLRLEAAGGAVAASLVSAGGRPQVRPTGTLAGPARLTLNARVATDPRTLRGWVGAALSAADGAAGAHTAVSLQRALAPARPVPTYRFPPGVGGAGLGTA